MYEKVVYIESRLHDIRHIIIIRYMWSVYILYIVFGLGEIQGSKQDLLGFQVYSSNT